MSFALAAAVAVPVLADGPKPRKPRLEVRASPRMGFSPVNVLLTAELMGGDDVEEFHCPEIEWDWDDGGKSVHEADCTPFEAGTRIQRRFTAEHEYRRAGSYRVKATMRRSGRNLAVASATVTVRAGLGDPTIER
ncbi:MAG TPA: hypothetical protein VFO85_17180 [Vicinamibacteria bacterium]|nr:hypothetical protein [Vicinamibacteria bacterium]